MTKSEALQVAKPILFNTEMVRAIQGGTKTATRRLIKPKYDNTHIEIIKNKYGRQLVEIQNEDDVKVTVNHDGTHCRQLRAMQEITPKYRVGDILYVRETWCKHRFMPPDDKAIPVGFKYFDYYYRANGEISNSDGSKFKWKPSAQMPKEAARIFLRVTGARVERLQDIITGDYKTPLNINREGLLKPCLNCTHHNGDCKDFIANNTCRLVDSYIDLWNSTIKKSDRDKYGWEANPWVWVIEFERLGVTE